MRFVAL